MTGMDIFALIVLLILVATVIFVFVFLGMWPGKVARQRNHPQADAINIGSWVGLIAGGVLWPLILIWAFTKPLSRPSPGAAPAADEELSSRLNALENRLVALESGVSGKGGTV